MPFPPRVERVELRKLGRISRACLEIAESGIKDREFQQSFAGTFDGAVNLNPAEVLEVRLIDLKELADAFVGQPHAFTPWYRQRVADLGLCAPWAAR
jgi:isopentenyldiphosphate isomerase